MSNLPREVDVNGIKLSPMVRFAGTHKGVSFELCNWRVLQEKTIWNYYIYIRERQMQPNIFASVWLEPEVKEFFGRKRVSYDYDTSPLGVVDMHGGMTYYARMGYPVGFRAIKIGCDYNHYQDFEKVGEYTVDEVAADCIASIEHCIKIFEISPEDIKEPLLLTDSESRPIGANGDTVVESGL